LKGKITFRSFLKSVRKILFWTISVILMLMVVLILLLQTSFFQNFLSDQVLSLINNKTRETVSIEKVKIRWFDQVSVSGLELRDYQDNLMLNTAEVTVNFGLRRLLTNGNISFDEINVTDGALDLRKYQDSLNINLVEFINDLKQLTSKPKDTTVAPPQLKIATVNLDQFTFIYDNQLNDSLAEGKFDYGHFKLSIPEGGFSNFLLWSDTIRMNINSFSSIDSVSGMELNSLSTDFELNSQNILLKNLNLITPDSQVDGDLGLHFTDFGALGDFINEVDLDVSLNESVVSQTDINFFADLPFNDFQAEVTGNIKGPISRLAIQDLILDFGENSRLVGNFDFMGLPKLDETFIDARISEGQIDQTDFKIFGNFDFDQASELGQLNFKGRFLGFVHDFVANGDFQTPLGRFSSDINLKFPKGWENAQYSGKMELFNFNVGLLIGEKKAIQKVNLKGSLKGSGLRVDNANFYLDAVLRNSQIFGYQYDKIKAKGQFAASFFEGELNVTDSNCLVTSTASVDLSEKPEIVKLNSNIQTLRLQELGFSPEKLDIQGVISADLMSLNIDSLEGNVRVDSLDINWKNKSVSVDSILVGSTRRNGIRDIQFVLPDLDFHMEGDFTFSQISQDFKIISSDLERYFDTDKTQSHISKTSNEYTIDFEILYDDINEYLNLFSEAPIFITPKGEIAGTYYQRNNATLSFFAEIDSVNYANVGFAKNTLDINFSKQMDSTMIIASAFVESKAQYWKDNPPTEDLSLEAVWLDNKINANLHIEQPANDSYANVNGEMLLAKDQLIYQFKPSDLTAFGEQWFFNPDNKITFRQNRIDIAKLELYQKNQSILLEGNYSDSMETALNLKFDDFDLHTLETLLPERIGGVMNSVIEFDRPNSSEPFRLKSDLQISDFSVDNLPVGNIRGNTYWDNKLEGLRLDLNVQKEGVNTIDVYGYFKPATSEEQFNINATFEEASLRLLEPFAGEVVSELGGFASGEISLTGNVKYPILRGEAYLSQGEFKLNYLGTNYKFDGALEFDNNKVVLSTINLMDEKNDKAVLTGNVAHSGLDDISLDLRLNAQNFQFLNTSSTDNSLYYGVANGTGVIDVTGNLNDILIKAQATTEKGTKIFIPLTSDSEVNQKDYISFVDFSDSTQTVDIEQVVQESISGIRLDFDLDVTTDAYVELIFNIRTGDIIRGRGNGNLNLVLDTNGDFELFGDISIDEGAYNFTIPAIGINKEFNVVEGSTISWYGDPYAGKLDLDATYRQLASFDNYHGFVEGENPNVTSQKYPVIVLLDLQGDMLSPQIDFEIKLEDTQASLISQEQQDMAEINNDEQELKRQVFSLLILRKFSPRNSYLGGSNTAVQGSVSEFLSNQLSYFVSQMDDNLEVDIDLASLDNNAFNTFQLRLSYTFLDGRLRVSGAGGLPQNNTEEVSTGMNNYLGDWSIRYLITQDGHLRVKAFSQTDQIRDNQRETGVSFQFVKSFDDFKELMTSTRKKALQNPKPSQD